MEYTKSYAELFASKDDFVVLRKPLIRLLERTDYAIIVAEIDSRASWFERGADKYQDHYFDGRWWMYDTYESWNKEYFPGLSIRTVKSMFATLKSSGIIFQVKRFDRDKNITRCWYSVNYELLSAMFENGIKLSDVQKQFPAVKGEDISEKIKKIVNFYVQTSHSTTCESCTLYNIYNNNIYNTITENSKQRIKREGYFSKSETDKQQPLYDLARQYLLADGHTEKYDALRILDFLSLYGLHYTQKTGKRLTCRPSQIAGIIERACQSIEEDGDTTLFDLEEEQRAWIVSKYFRTNYAGDCDYNIFHFLSGDILRNKYFEMCREFGL